MRVNMMICAMLMLQYCRASCHALICMYWCSLACLIVFWFGSYLSKYKYEWMNEIPAWHDMLSRSRMLNTHDYLFMNIALVTFFLLIVNIGNSVNGKNWMQNLVWFVGVVWACLIPIQKWQDKTRQDIVAVLWWIIQTWNMISKQWFYKLCNPFQLQPTPFPF